MNQQNTEWVIEIELDESTQSEIIIEKAGYEDEPDHPSGQVDVDSSKKEDEDEKTRIDIRRNPHFFLPEGTLTRASREPQPPPKPKKKT